MEKVLLTGVCPNCYVYVMLSPDVKESEIINCDDCRTPLLIEHVGTIKTVTLTKAPQAILL